jgi:hypothetical protein
MQPRAATGTGRREAKLDVLAGQEAGDVTERRGPDEVWHAAGTAQRQRPGGCAGGRDFARRAALGLAGREVPDQARRVGEDAFDDERGRTQCRGVASEA